MDVGADMFNGGGFLPGPAQGTTPGTEKKERTVSSLRAFTIKQLHDVIANEPSADGDLDIDGAPVNNLTIVGKIVSVDEHANSLLLTLDDGTGRASVKHWGDADGDDGDAAAARRAAWRPGAYVRVHGNVRSFDGKRSIIAFNVRPVTDSNEITHHQLQCILQHAHLKAGAPGAGRDAVPVSAAAGGVPAQPVFGAAPGAAAAPAAPAAVGGAATAAVVGPDGLTGLQRDVKLAVQALGAGANGAAVDAVCAQLAGAGHGAAAVREGVAFLLEEGHLYSTVDENHVKVA